MTWTRVTLHSHKYEPQIQARRYLYAALKSKGVPCHLIHGFAQGGFDFQQLWVLGNQKTFKSISAILKDYSRLIGEDTCLLLPHNPASIKGKRSLESITRAHIDYIHAQDLESLLK